VHSAVIGRPVCSIPFRSCTTNARLGCFPDGHLGGLPPFLSGVCGPVRCRYSWQIHGDKWRTSQTAPRFFGSVASAFRLVTVFPDIPSGDAYLRCAEYQAEICVLSSPAHDRSRRASGGLGSIHSDGVSWECSSVNCIDLGSLSGGVAPLPAASSERPLRSW
jgi:hypothetical protein